MDLITDLFSRHGLIAVAIAVLLHQLGAPLPSTPLLLLLGAESVSRDGFALQAFAAITGAAMVANLLWFWAGRRLGRRVLAALCRVSISPDSCVRQNEISFARRGALTLLIAKFVPGLSMLAPPLAGALGMTAGRFLTWNLLGSALWAAAGLAAGRVFHAQIDALLRELARLGSAAIALGVAVVAAYLAWRLWRRAVVRRELNGFERLEPADVAALQQQGCQIVFVDVRGGPPASRIPGARHLDLGALGDAALAGWPVEAEFITYCACPNDVSAARAAQWLKARGHQARVLRGGIDAWQQAGLALEAV
ncbi:VTT domain-containing protein [Pelomonas parva]|uniref:VTT domain-containing protein n=1 Tax=Pelomonas parva TaxID=3299032 RepID=A0ABW7FAD2_9BURK